MKVKRAEISEDETRSSASAGLPLLPPTSGLIELAVLTAIIVLVDRVLPDVELADIQPNPFWLPVLLLSLQYGTVSGLLAAGVALLVTVMSGLPPEGVGENHFNYALRVYTQPILWFAAAVILGQFRMRQIAAKEALRRSVEELSRSRAVLAGYSTRLRARCERLERERAGKVDGSGVDILQQLARLGDSSEGVGTAFDGLIKSAFGGASASVSMLAEGKLAVVATSGWEEPAAWLKEIGVAHPLYRAVVTEAVSLTVLASGDEHRLAGEGLVAVPIRSDGGRGAVTGMVKLEHASPDDLSEATPAALAAIALALSARFSARDVQGSKQGRIGEALEAVQGRLLRPLRWLPRQSEPVALPQDQSRDQAAQPKVVR